MDYSSASSESSVTSPAFQGQDQEVESKQEHELLVPKQEPKDKPSRSTELFNFSIRLRRPQTLASRQLIHLFRRNATETWDYLMGNRSARNTRNTREVVVEEQRDEEEEEGARRGGHGYEIHTGFFRRHVPPPHFYESEEEEEDENEEEKSASSRYIVETSDYPRRNENAKDDQEEDEEEEEEDEEDRVNSPSVVEISAEEFILSGGVVSKKSC